MPVRYKEIYDRALARKGGRDHLHALLLSSHPQDYLSTLTSDRLLAYMTKCIFQSGFVWKIIEKKWPGFEEAFYQFDIDTLYKLEPEEWDTYAQDTRIVRNPQKIRSVFENMMMIKLYEEKGQSFATFLQEWPETDQVGLLSYLKKNGSRLGGMTGQYFLRRIGKESFILSKDVVRCLQESGLDIKDNPSSKRELALIQDTFNTLHNETGESMTTLSKLMAYSIGDNFDNEIVQSERNRFENVL